MSFKKLMRKPRVLLCGAVLSIALFVQGGITLETVSGCKVAEVIESIQAQSEYRFSYPKEIAFVGLNKVNLKDVSLQDALDKLFEGTQIDFSIADNVVYLRLKEEDRVKKDKESSDRENKELESPEGENNELESLEDENNELESPDSESIDKEKKNNTETSALASGALGSKHTISGTIIDETGEPLIGASVRIKGTNTAVATDFDGNYSIETTQEDPVIECSYVGYAPVEIKTKGKSNVNIEMRPDSEMLQEVVVTALGIKRDKKSLGYAVQEVGADALNTTGDPSVIGALDGKVAGVQMTSANTGLGGSTKVTIRGNSSLTDNNQPLWIVDGVPFSDVQSSDASAYAGYDRGGTSFDLNPEDIESISVLKGANAAALYGSRAGNGVILVTTKKGKKGQGMGVTYNANFTWSKVAGTIGFQDKYGQGSRGELLWVGQDGIVVPMPSEPLSQNNTQDWEDYNNYLDCRVLTGELAFGPMFDGAMQRAYNGELSPYSYTGNKLKDYFKTGFSQFHTVAVSSATESSHFRASMGYNDNRGLFKDETLDKLNIDLNAGAKLAAFFELDGKISLSRTKAENRPLTGLNGEVAQLLLIPGNIPLDYLQNYSTSERAHINWFGPNQQYSNPYYVRHRFSNSDERWRSFGYFSATATFTPWLKFRAKYAFDFYYTRIFTSDLSLADQAIAPAGGVWQDKVNTDEMNRTDESHFEHNIEAILQGNNQFGEDYSFVWSAGANIMYQQSEGLGVGVINLLDKGNWIFNTAERLHSANNYGFSRSMYSVFASASIGWRNYAYLDATARNDWSSTLPSKNCSFFYPSVSLSLLTTDFLRMEFGTEIPQWINYAKIRGSYAQVGKDPEPYNLYNTAKYQFDNGIRVPVVNSIKMNDNLKPELKTSWEVGLDMKFVNNRFGFDLTYYSTSTKYQAMLVAASSPWSQQWINAGRVTNKGFELMLYATLVQGRDFTFDVNVNLSRNRSRVEELAPGVDYVYFNGDPNMPVKVGSVSGGSLGDIYANNMLRRDSQGRLVIGSNGLPMPQTGNGNLEKWLLEHPIGNIEPDMMMSLTPQLRWKGIHVSALFDFKFGGDIVSVSEGMATAVGTSERTAERGQYKDKGGVKDYYMVVPGVKEDGTPNDIEVSAQSYYSTIGLYKSQKGYAEEFVHDASYIRLKELSVGYLFPSRILRRTPLQQLKLSFVARNLCYLLKHAPGNPDGGYDTSMFSQALDFAAVPYTRTLGFSLTVGF